MTELNEAELSDAARSILRDPAFIKAMTTLRSQYETDWRNSAPGATAEREVIYFRLLGLEELLRDIEAVMKGAQVTSYNRTLRGSNR